MLTFCHFLYPHLIIVRYITWIHFQFDFKLFQPCLNHQFAGAFFNVRAIASQRPHSDESTQWKTIYYWPFWFYIFVGSRKWSPWFLHYVCNHQSNASRYSSHTVYKHIGSLSFFFNEFEAILKKYWDVAWLMINHRNIQVFNMFGNFISKIFSLDCSDYSSYAVLWIKSKVLFNVSGLHAT